MGLGPSSTGMCRPRMRGRTAVDTGPATLAECSPPLRSGQRHDAVRDQGPARHRDRWRPPETPVAMRPSGRARAPRGTRRNARPGRAVAGRPDDLGDGCQRRRLDLPAVRRRRPADPHGRSARDRRAAVDRARTRRRPPPRGGARRAPRHGPRDRRPPGRLARPRDAHPDDRRRDEARAAGRRVDHPDAPRRPPRGHRLGRSRRRRRGPPAGPPSRRGLGRRGPAHRTRPGLRRTSGPSVSTATPGTTASSRSPATWRPRSSTTAGSSARCPR